MLSSEDTSFLSADDFMKTAYPKTVGEALSPPDTATAFDSKVLDSMMADVKKPLDTIRDGIDPKIIHIYKDFFVGGMYIAGSDTSHGLGKDYSVSVIINAKTGEVVADIVSNVLSPDEFAYHTVKLLDLFRNPRWYIESNDWGGMTILAASKLNYRNFGYQDEAKTKVGFQTNVNTRNQLWGELISGINNRQIVIYNPDGIAQFRDLIRNAEKGGKVEARQGGNDDYPMAVGIAWLKRGEALAHEWLNKPVKGGLTFHEVGSYR
jgi:hypothetical protein